MSLSDKIHEKLEPFIKNKRLMKKFGIAFFFGLIIEILLILFFGYGIYSLF